MMSNAWRKVVISEHADLRKKDNCLLIAKNDDCYAIILSTVNRIIAAHGYNTSIGINHHSSRNPFNLSCDIMEPFRPFVDEVVYQGNRQFDLSMRKLLISVTSKEIVYNGSEMSLETALERFILDVIRAIETNDMNMGGIGFAC